MELVSHISEGTISKQKESQQQVNWKLILKAWESLATGAEQQNERTWSGFQKEHPGSCREDVLDTGVPT